MVQDDFRALLEAGDVQALRDAWTKLTPHLPQPANFEAAEIAMHMARTQAVKVTLRARAYSHRWLLERGFPSQLPDELKPHAEQLYPEVVECVGVFVGTPASDVLKPVAAAVRDAMLDAVQDAQASGERSPDVIRARALEARTTTLKTLLGVRQ